MESAMDASQSNSGSEQPPITAGEKPQEAEIRGGGETVEDEVLVSKAQKLMNMITSSQENPNPKVLHALASILENQEARYMKETGHSSPNNASARSSHVIGRLATIIRENDDFFELIASTYLSETRYSMAVQAAASRLLLSCSPTWMFPHVFEEEVLENIKVWAMDDNASSSAGHRKPDLGQSKSSDFEMRKTYSTGLLAVCLTGAGQLLEDVLTSGLSSKLMHYLRIRVLGETSASQHSHITENRSINTVSGRGRDDGRARMNQPMDAVPFGETRTLENGSLLDPRTGRNDDSNAGRLVHGEEDWIKGDHNGDLVQVTDVDKLKTHERNCAGRSSGNEDIDDNVRDDSYRRKLTRSLSRSRDRTRVHEGAPGNEQSIVSPVSGSRLAQSNSSVDRNLLKSLDCKEVADGTKVTIRTVADKSAPEKEDFDSYRVGARDITDLVKSAVRAAEAEARAANAPLEAVKAAGDAAAELVKSAAVDEFKATNDEDSAVLAASRAASTVIDAAAAIEATRNSHSEVADASISGAGDTESVEDIVDVMIPNCELLAQHREKFCIQCLVILGEYIEVLGPVMQEKGVDVCLVLLQRYSKLTDDIEAAILLPDVLKLICALAAHKKFAALFVDRGGMQKLLAVPRVSYTLFGLSSCLFTIGSLQGVMEHVCTLPSHIVHEVVQLGLLLFECSQDQARKNAALFFAAVFAFRAVLDAFDALDGLQKLLGHLNEAASVRSGVNSGTLGSTGSHRNDRSNEVLTSSEKQIAYHTSVALRQYFRAQLLLLVDSLRPNKSSRSAARNIPSVKAAYKPLDISNEAMDTLLLQIQKDRKLGPAFARARWSAVDKFLACNGHVTMLELCQAPPVERYLHDLLQYALGVLQIVTLVPYSRKLIVTTTLSNNRVGIAVILDAASGPGYSDPEIVQQALNVLVNLVCPPPSISNKPSQLIQGNHSLSVQGSSGPGTENRERNSEQNHTDRAMPNQSEPRERNSEAIQTPVASGLVGDRRISLGAGAGCAGLAAQLEQGYRQARDAVRSNSGIKILLQLIQTRIVTPPAMLDCLRALACRVLLGLARDETIAHILTKLQVGKKLSELIRDLSSQASGTEQSRWQTELTQVSLELIAIVTNSGRASTLAATDAATPTLRRIERAAIAAATPISYHSRELLTLIHEHLQACGLSSSAATLLKEAQLTPLASMVAPSSLAHHVSAQEIPSFQIQWPSTRTSGGFFSNGLKAIAGQDPDQSKCDTDESVKKKPLVFSSSLSASRSHNHQSSDLETPIFRKVHSTSVKHTESPSTVETPMASVGKAAVDSETQTKTPIVLPMKRKLTEAKEINLTSLKRQNTGDLGLRSPSFQTPNSGRRMNFFDSSGFFTPISGLKDSLGRRSNNLHSDILDESAQQSETPAGGLSTDLQSGGTDRLSLDSIVVQYLKHQHRQCPAPITTLPPLSLLHPHVCPEPRRSLDTPSNVTARLSTREYRSMYGGTHGNRRDRQFVYSRFRPMRSCRDDASSLLTSMTFLRDSQLAAGFHTGELKTFDTYNSTVLETCVGHQSPITMVESFWGDDTQLLLSSSTFDVKLWDASSITGGPIHWFEDCRTAKFGHSGTVLAALSADSSERNILLYDVRTFQLDQKLTDTSATSSRGQSYSLVHFSPDDTLLLWNGVLWDRRSSSHVHRFDQFTDYGGGGFHPAGNEVIINSEVWDLRKFRLLRSVPSLDQTTITFNCQGDILYAILRRNLDDAMSAVQARRAKHPLFAAFRTLDAINYSDIATTSVDRCVLDFATEPTDSIVGLVTLDDPADMASSARIYEIGRRRPTDDDSDPDDAEESEDEDDEDDDDIDGDPILGPILEGDEDSGNDGSDDDDGGSALEDDDDDDLDDEDVDFFVNQVGLNGGGGMLEIMSDGDDDDDSEDDLLDSYSSGDEEYMGNDFMSSLTETIGDTFRPHFPELQKLLLKCLQDESSNRVRIAALKAVGSFLECALDGAEVVQFRDFIPSILSVSRQCLASGEEDVAIIAFEIFDELIESPAPLLGDSVKSIVQFSLEVCSNQNLELNTRHQAIQIISWLAKYKSKSLKKHKLVDPILHVMCPLLAESSDRDDDDDLAPDRASAEVIDTMALNLPKQVFAPVLQFASISSQNVNLKHREAAVTSLGVISEGCFNLMKENLQPILQIVLGALRDPEQVVRGAASFALGQFAEYLQPEIVSHYESFLPCILNALEDVSDEVKEKSYYALAAFCENMGEEILQFLDPLMAKLLGALHNSPKKLQETCMSAIGSVAAAAEQAFLPYAERVLELMKNFMVRTSDEDLILRARATELVGIVAMSVGRAMMEPILPPYIEAAIAGFALDYSELREYTHGFFSNVAEVLDDSFTQYLPHIVPLAFTSCNLDDGSAVDIDESDGEENMNGFGGVSSDDEAHDEPRVRNISIRTGVLDEKAAATQALGLFALHTKSSFAPYLEETLKILVRQAGYFHEDVRLQTITSLKHVLTATEAVCQGHPDRSEMANTVLDTIMNIYIKTMDEDDDKEVVAQACTSVADIVRDIGYAAVESYMPRLVEATLMLLREESACQQVESDGDGDDDYSEHDEVLMDAVSDLLPAFAKSMGPNFAPILAKFFGPLKKFAQASRPPQDRTMVVACLAEVAQYMGAPISSYVDMVMPLVVKELMSSDSTNRRNAAFCAGEFCKNGGDAALKYYGDVLKGLYPLFGGSEPDDAVRDNAAGAVARMIMVHPEAIPLHQVLPVFVRVLPLKEDHAESMAVYTCIGNLILSSNPQILSLVPDLVRVFAEVLLSPVETSEVKSLISGAFSHLISTYGEHMQPVLSALPPAHANVLAAFAQKS